MFGFRVTIVGEMPANHDRCEQNSQQLRGVVADVAAYLKRNGFSVDLCTVNGGDVVPTTKQPKQETKAKPEAKIEQPPATPDPDGDKGK